MEVEPLRGLRGASRRGEEHRCIQRKRNAAPKTVNCRSAATDHTAW
jgi:hypothetical protein